MNIQLAFIYCFITIVVLYAVLWLDNRYFGGSNSLDNESIDSNEKILRISVLCGIIMWLIIVYFIYRAEQEIPALVSNNLLILQEKF